MAFNNKENFVAIYTLPKEVPAPLLQATLSGNMLTVTWTGGHLEETPDINGQWTAVAGNPQGTYSVPITGAPRKFYRAVAP